ncbi:winged helix-turn-helix transcriptional regulator [Ideonella sp. 4Y11]|uniref:Winged helix-turn-helix transcriptional regulator n=1 Tax=Ideonella aquatica TaxID=2824119 RepID=A0A941BGR8_9BURK|nr:winged helix-turn-helix domain-containing protein [Ideonella aquatica]MBQ0960116.1 winged helix-turn-helix transcriptional regulator [Ideonella aquatica]
MSHQYDFGPFQLDVWQRELRRRQQLVALSPKLFELLRLLVEQHHRVVTRQEILSRVWAGRVTTPGVLPQAVLKLRAALEEDPAQPWIRSVRGVGYRFLGEVREGLPQAPRAPHRPDPVGLRLGLMPCLNRTGDDSLQWLSLGLPALLHQMLEAEPRLALFGPGPPLAPAEPVPASLGLDGVLQGCLVRHSGALGLHSQLVSADGRVLHTDSMCEPRWDMLCTRWAHSVHTALCPGSDIRLVALSPDPFALEAFARGSSLLLRGDGALARPLLQVAHDLLPDQPAVHTALLRATALAGDASG